MLVISICLFCQQARNPALAYWLLELLLTTPSSLSSLTTHRGGALVVLAETLLVRAHFVSFLRLRTRRLRARAVVRDDGRLWRASATARSCRASAGARAALDGPARHGRAAPAGGAAVRAHRVAARLLRARARARGGAQRAARRRRAPATSRRVVAARALVVAAGPARAARGGARARRAARLDAAAPLAVDRRRSVWPQRRRRRRRRRRHRFAHLGGATARRRGGLSRRRRQQRCVPTHASSGVFGSDSAPQASWAASAST